jgi:hypothetical protein
MTDNGFPAHSDEAAEPFGAVDDGRTDTQNINMGKMAMQQRFQRYLSKKSMI